MKRILAAPIAALALVACNTTPIVPPGPPQVDVAKAEYSLEVAFNAVGSAYLQFGDQLSPADHQTAKMALLEAGDALKAARTAEQIGDGGTFAIQFANFVRLYNQVKALLPSTAALPALPAQLQ